MALSLQEEQDLIRLAADPSDPAGTDSYPLTEFIYRASFGQCADFLNSAKNIDSGANPNAAEYQRKYLNVANKVINRDGSTIDSIYKMFISLLADVSAVTWANISSVSDASFEDVINGSHAADPTGEASINSVFEKVAGILPHEKTEWDSL